MVIAIIGFLLLLAVPSFMRQVDQVRYSEIVLAAAELRKAVDICYALKRDLGQCVPAQDASVRKQVAHLDQIEIFSDSSIKLKSDGFFEVIINTTVTPDWLEYVFHGKVNANNDKIIWRFYSPSQCLKYGLCQPWE